MPTRRIIVVGGVAAGPAAVAEARRTDAEAEIILIERGGDISYSACEMPIFLAGELSGADRLVRYTAERFAARFQCSVRLHTEVVSVEPATRHVEVVDGRTGERESLWYDALVLATGVEAVVPDALRTASHHVHVLRRLEDARVIRRHLETAKKGHVVVIGAGYVGLDGVEAFHRAGWRCTLLASGGRILGDALDSEAAGWVRTALERDGVAVRDERAVGLDVDSDGSVRAVRTDKGERIGCQMVLVATGTRANVGLAKQAGLKLGPAGGLLVQDTLQTSESAIWACGDVVDFTDLITGNPVHAPVALNAFRSGRVAGRNAARGGRGRPARMAPVVHAAAVSVAEL
jgi:NADPH-dependent 2,4-dienoyl-CoA reductase/sulfur reductase-like enzyme